MTPKTLRVLPLVCLALWIVYADPTSQTLGSAVQADVQAFVRARVAAHQGLTRFSFGVYSDIHMAPTGGLTQTQWQTVLRQWRDRGHIFGLIVGDLGFGNATDPANVLAGPQAVPDAPPVLWTMGNHETDGIGKRAWIDALWPGAVQPASWTPQAGVAPGNADHVYYSFDIGPNTHFIVLDGDYMTFDGITARVRQTFGQRQLAWLDADIRANSTKNILVFIHEPIDQQVTGSTPDYTLNDKGGLIDMLAAHPKQAIVFSGHFHNLLGVTRWKGISSVHVAGTTPTSYGQPDTYGVNVAIDGLNITVTQAGQTTNFDLHPMNLVETSGPNQMVRVAEDGANSGRAVTPSMSVVAAESGVTPTYGTLMLKAPATTWYAPRFISEQLIKIQPGMKFSFDIFLSGVVNGNDAVAVQPSWYMKNGTVPPRVVDQNGLHLSQRPRDGMFFMYNDDLPYLGGRATNQWYHREFDLSALAGNYVDGIYLTEAANRVNVGAIYVDNIRFTWPGTAPPNASPTVALTSPASGAAFTAPATINLTATAGDTDGTVSQVSFYAGATLLGTSTTAPYAFSWTNVAAGSYTLTAVARDNANATTTSSPVTVTVSVAPPPPSSITPGATYIATDTTTSGNWKGVFGTEGYMLAGDATSLPAYATAQQTGSNAWTWTTLTADTRALLRAATTTRFAATWYGSTMDLNVNVADGLSHRVSLYLLDWDARGRAVAIDALDTVTGAVLDTRSVSSFAGGTYVTWALKGRVTLRVKNAGLANAVYSAVFFDPAGAVPPPPPPPPPPAVGNTAVFVASDATTRGNWKGVYGASGFSIPNDGTTLPAYATLRVTGAQPWTWASWTADTRALQKSVGPDRIASTWYGNVAEIEVTITDGNSHDFSVYFLDWDARSRAETVQVLNADTGAVLDSRPMSAFGNGVYLKWTISGHVKIRISWTSGANMVFNGLFFDR